MTKFSDLKLDPKVLSAIADAGYDSPTPIQEGAIPPALDGRDVLGIAQTGTGKTASFVLPMITLLRRGRARARMPRSLVLAPTRELAAQVAENFDTYAKNTKLTKALLIGGVSFKEQDVLIDKGVDVLIATPGRLLDHFERGKLLLTGVQVMVVDEADRMLDMGFIPDIERIFGLTPFTRQTLFFSATMAPEIERITNTFLSNPAKIEVARQATASETIEQGVVMFRGGSRGSMASEKRKLLRALIDAEGDKCTNAMIFCNRKTDVDTVAKSLKKSGYDAAPIHGDLDQSQRTRTLTEFRDQTLKYLVCSDVAARGLDIPDVSHVFNFDVPSHPEDYVHRIGRTGRAGKSGKAIMICAPLDTKNLDGVQRLLGKDVPVLDNPLQSGAAPAPTDTPDADKKPTRTRRGRKKADQATDDAPAPETMAETATKTADVPADIKDAAAEAPADAPSDTPKRSRGGRGRGRDKGDNDQTNRGRDSEKDDQAGRGKSRDRGRDGGNRVVGMGDHMPSFIELSFEDRRENS
ncbi:MAG: DEAD/DEAH box helicase [Rhodobacteraceae bacterium]|nr:DEAD/DEAH box helicase [Paracoccaceae bacterium]